MTGRTAKNEQAPPLAGPAFRRNAEEKLAVFVYSAQKHGEGRRIVGYL